MKSRFRKSGGQKRKTDSEGTGRGSPKILRSTTEIDQAGETNRVHRYQITNIIKTTPSYCSAFARTPEGKAVVIKMMSSGYSRGIYDDLAKLSHKNIAQVSTPASSPHLIQLQCFERSDLKDRLQSTYGGVIVMENTARPWFTQLLDAVEYLHANNIVHKDISCSKIYVQGDNTLKLTGFGKAARYDGKPHCGVVGTIGYQAPEVLREYEKYNPIPVDMYALGVVLYFVLTHSFPCGDDEESCKKMAGRIVVFDGQKKVSEEVMELIKGLLAYVVADRWCVKRLRHSDWMKEKCTRVHLAAWI